MLDLPRGTGFGRPWENGTTTIDAVAGLPELAALSRLTRARLYSRHIEKILEKVDGRYWTINAPTGLNSTMLTATGHHEFNEYYEILARTVAIGQVDGLRERLPQNPHWWQRGASWFDAFYGVNDTAEEGTEKAGATDRDGALLRMQMRRESTGRDTAAVVIEALDEMKCSDGYSGFVRSNRGTVRRDNIQHSSIIANWIAQAGFALTGNKNITRGGVFNSRGHLLHIGSKAV
jgi:hypothetical protein